MAKSLLELLESEKELVEEIIPHFEALGPKDKLKLAKEDLLECRKKISGYLVFLEVLREN